MNREKLAWAVSAILLATLAFQMPRTLAQRDDDYSFVRTLVDIHRRVEDNYVEPVNDAKLEQGAIDGMLGQLDPYSVYIPPARQEDFDRMLEGSFKGVGIQLNQLDNGQVEVVSPIDGSPAFKAGVMAGDILLKVNGESIENLRLPDIVKKIGGPLGTKVTLVVRHVTGDEATLSMTRQEIVVPTIKGYQRKPDNTWDYFVCDDPKIAYVRITQFTPDTFQGLQPVMQQVLKDGMKGLILDLRFNPGGRLDQAIQVVNLFVDHGTIVVTKGRNRPEQRQEASPNGVLPPFPMIVLINEHSASASEIVAGSLMDNHRAVVVGERSYGKGSVQEVIPLDEKGGELKLTVAYYYLPSGRLVHRRKDATDWGVQPQIVVPMDAAAEEKMATERYEQELFRRPVPKSVTRPTTQQTAAVPATQPTDTQLAAAVNTMLGVIVFEDQRNSGHAQAMANNAAPLGATTQPSTTAPATQQ